MKNLFFIKFKESIYNFILELIPFLISHQNIHYLKM